MRKILGTALLTAVLVTGAAACSDDSSGSAQDAAPTLNAATKRYCGELQRVGSTFTDPGIDAIFEDHPDPTLADWAAFLPTPVAKIRTFADEVEAIEQPTDVPEAVSRNLANALVKLRKAADLYEAEIAAANAGDRAQFDSEGERAKALAPQIGKSMQAAGAACGLGDTGK